MGTAVGYCRFYFVVIIVLLIIPLLYDQFNVARYADGVILVFNLKSLLNDCECSKPSRKAISLRDNAVPDNFSFAASITLS